MDNTSNNSTAYNASVSNSRMTIHCDGSVGIQNTSPYAPLNIGNPAVPTSDGYIVFSKCHDRTVDPSRKWWATVESNQSRAGGPRGHEG